MLTSEEPGFDNELNDTYKSDVGSSQSTPIAHQLHFDVRSPLSRYVEMVERT